MVGEDVAWLALHLGSQKMSVTRTTHFCKCDLMYLLWKQLLRCFGNNKICTRFEARLTCEVRYLSDVVL